MSKSSREVRLRAQKKYYQKNKDTPEYKARSKFYHDRYRTQNPQREVLYTRQRIKEGTEFINSFKNAPCLDCGQLFPSCAMDFDHVRGNKIRGIGEMVTSSKQAILVEIAKCELVCANCHRIRTYNRLQNAKADK